MHVFVCAYDECHNLNYICVCVCVCVCVFSCLAGTRIMS